MYIIPFCKHKVNNFKKLLLTHHFFCDIIIPTRKTALVVSTSKMFYLKPSTWQSRRLFLYVNYNYHH